MGFGDTASELLDQQITELRSLLADLQGLDLWPPWDAAATLVDLVSKAYSVATQPPEPDPVRLRDAAEEWRLIAAGLGRAGDDLAAARSGVSSTVWEGDAGNAFRGSLEVFGTRMGTVPTAADGVASALESMATAMEDARKRHRDAWGGLRKHLSITWSDALPWELVDKLRGIVAEVVAAIEDLIGAYENAATAAAACRRDVRAAMDEIELPDHLPAGATSIIDVVNEWDDDSGPLDGSVLERYDTAVDAMTPQQRAELRRLLDGTSDPTARAWIIAAVASGLTGAALTRYVHQLRQLTPSQVDALDPAAMADGQRVQPDQTTCGSSALVMSRMENDPAFAMWLLTGYDPVRDVTDTTDYSSAADPSGVTDRFEQAALDMHHTTNGLHDQDGGLQVPWPESLGTQPWALASEMSADGGSGVPGASYTPELVDPQDRGRSFDDVVRASEDGHTVPFYIGDDTSPRHVALVTASSGDQLTVYEPASGRTITVSRDDWVAGNLDVGGWSEPWLVITPGS